MCTVEISSHGTSDHNDLRNKNNKQQFRFQDMKNSNSSNFTKITVSTFPTDKT